MLCELEASEAVVEALLKGSNHKVPKVVLACTQALTRAVESFGTPSVIPAKPILKGVSHLFESKDAKVRDAAKALTVELTRWLGPDAVRRDLLEKMRAGMQAEVTEMTAAAPARAPRATRRLRKDGDRAEAEPMDVDGGEGGADAGGDPAAASAFPDAYEFSDPADVLDTLEKAPANKEQPKFWGAVASSKWKERLGALTQLRELADHPRLASGDYGDVARAIKRVVTKDANIACVGEACASAGALAKGLRREFRSEARLVLPGMLDKLKDKNASVVQKNQDALLSFPGTVLPSQTSPTTSSPRSDIRCPRCARRRWRGSPPPPRSPTRPPPPPSTRPSSRPSSSARTIESQTCARRPSTLSPPWDAPGREVAIHRQARRCARRRQKSQGGRGVRRRRKSRPARRSGRQQTQRDVDGGDQTREAGDGGRVASRIRLGARETRDGRVGTEAGRRVDEVNGRCRGVVGVRLLRRGRRSERGRARVQGGGRRAHDCAFWLGGCRAAPIRRLETAIGGGGRRGGGCARDVPGGGGRRAREVVTRGLAVVPGFDDKNFQVLGRVFEILGALADKAAGFSKPDGARVVSGAAQKVADVKLRGPATAALMSVTEALGPKFVVAQLHKHTATHKKPEGDGRGASLLRLHRRRVRRGDARRRVQHLVVQIVPRRVQSRVQIRRGQVFGGDARGTRSGASGFPVRPEGHADEKPGRGIRA